MARSSRKAEPRVRKYLLYGSHQALARTVQHFAVAQTGRYKMTANILRQSAPRRHPVLTGIALFLLFSIQSRINISRTTSASSMLIPRQIQTTLRLQEFCSAQTEHASAHTRPSSLALFETMGLPAIFFIWSLPCQRHARRQPPPLQQHSRNHERALAPQNKPLHAFVI